MSKTKVTLDSFYKMFPDNGTPKSIVGNRTLTISEYSGNDVEINAMIVSSVTQYGSVYPINGNCVIELPANSNTLMFRVGNEPKNKATFSFELV
jgi:hypothetical protein